MRGPPCDLMNHIVPHLPLLDIRLPFPRSVLKYTAVSNQLFEIIAGHLAFEFGPRRVHVEIGFLALSLIPSSLMSMRKVLPMRSSRLKTGCPPCFLPGPEVLLARSFSTRGCEASTSSFSAVSTWMSSFFVSVCVDSPFH